MKTNDKKKNVGSRKTKKFKVELIKNSMSEKYRVVPPEEATGYKKWAKEKVEEWHDKFKPDYIVVTETAATPLGYIIKSAWKTAYPDEKIPKFLRVDPKQLPELPRFPEQEPEDALEHHKIVKSDERIKRYAESIAKLPHNEKTRILVFDEASEYKHSPRSVAHMLKVMWDLKSWLQVKAESTLPSPYNLKLGSQSHFPYSYENTHAVRPTYKRLSESHTSPIQKVSGAVGHNLRARILHGKDYRNKALDYIHDLKLAGKEAGIELREEEQRKKSLERKITSVIAIVGFVGSLAFLSFNVTGNAIADLPIKASSLIGLALFAIALIFGFFWLKNRRK